MTTTELIEQLAHDLIRLERQAKDESRRGNIRAAEHHWRVRNEVRDQRSRLLRERWAERRLVRA